MAEKDEVYYTPGLTPLLGIGEDTETSIVTAYLAEELSKIEAAFRQVSESFLTGIRTETDTLTAGETISAGDICYLGLDGLMYKADASSADTSRNILGLSESNLTSGQSGSFLFAGLYSTTGLEPGRVYYLSETAGEFTGVHPYTSGAVARVIGHGLSTTVLFFNPDKTWVEV